MSESRRRDARRPLELLGLSAVVALVIGGVVLASTHSFETGGIWAGVAFIVVLVVVAMLSLATDPEAGRDSDDEGPHGH